MFMFIALLAACQHPSNKSGEEYSLEEDHMAREAVDGEQLVMVEGELDGVYRVRLTVTPYGDHAPAQLLGDGVFRGALYWVADTGAGLWMREGAAVPAGWDSESLVTPDGNQALRIVAPDDVVFTITDW